MRYVKRPKYRIDPKKVQTTKDKKVSAEAIYKEALRDKKRMRKKH